jgi:4-amino-4-deoxy-L-arabinose transferase-like glycosyltransferase
MPATDTAYAPDLRTRNAQRAFWIVACSVATAHLTLLVLDIVGGTGFFRADRVPQRLGAMQALLASLSDDGKFVEVLVRNGNIGDYGLHAALFAVAGRLGVTVVQTLLAVPAALCVVYIARCAGSTWRIAMAAGLVYGFLPQTLAFPHQLLSEAFSNPLVIFGTAAFLHALDFNSRWSVWLLGGLCFGLAGLVRPALLLVPLLAASLALVLDRSPRVWPYTSFVAAGLAPFILWGMFMLSQTGKFGYGNSHQDLGINFSQSAAKVLLSEGLARADGSAPDWLPERIVREYPRGFANLYFKNTVVMLSDSGIGRLYVDLLGIGADARLQLQDPQTGWRAQLTNHGPIAMLKYGFRIAPGTITAGVLGALGFAFVNAGMAMTYVMQLRRGSPLWSNACPLTRRWALAFLLVLPLYVLTTSQVVAYAPSRLRSQGEFAWAILACMGWAAVYRRWRQSR